MVYRNDSSNYQGRYYTRTVEVSDEQYNAMKTFGDTAAGSSSSWTGNNEVSVTGTDGKTHTFSLFYNGLSNSCIDFTWKAMEIGGINADGNEGNILPTSNKDSVEETLDAFEKSAAGMKTAGGGGKGGSVGSGQVFQVCMGATLQCSFGMAPSSLVVLPINRVLTSFMPAANIMDHAPLVNILPFGMCTSIANPAVAAATAAALGVLTPMPCVPATVTPWAPGVPNLLIANMPAVDNNCMLNCLWAGVIKVVMPGQTTEFIP